jgi:cellulose synthase/poly-beta-1,6-N-acetylglucosamine synthase-like glycosyltransferase
MFTKGRPLLLVLGVGLVASGVANWRRWRRDCLAADELMRTAAVPVSFAATPRVSILVAAWNEAEFIERHVRSVARLRYQDLEYVLCAGGVDGTYEKARVYEGERLVVLRQLPGEGKQRALRRAYERSTGAVLFLSDADCELDDESFERVLAPIANEGERAATGTSRPLAEQLATSDFARAQWAVWCYRGPVQPKYIRGLLGRNAAVTRDALERAGAFRDDVRSGTDRHLAARLAEAGVTIRYVGDSWMATRYEERPSGYLRQQTRWLRNLVELGFRFGEPADLRGGLVAIGIASTVLLMTLAAPVLGLRAVVPLVLLLFHVVLSRARYFAFAARSLGQNWSVPWLKLPGYAYLDFLAWTRAAWQLASSRERPW